LLLNYVDYRTFSVEEYFSHCTAYAFYPGFFDAPAKVGGKWKEVFYWGTKEFYNRDRPLFMKYIPVIREISKAGWEPIPYARCRQKSIRIERYGRIEPSKPTYLTLYNAGLRARTIRVVLGSELLRAAGRSKPRIVDLLSPKTHIAIGSAGILTSRLPRRGVSVLKIISNSAAATLPNP
jgi:hypothetical protein